ncbi:universal stress protein [Ochrobactrum sp. WV_118_8]|jgi:nucleotide-binding universal stress UspA family protein|uniref:Nucleotide-binding universal stress UspA family protein n=1 Tax=Pseudochelatococcus contaminans TaxID=1538103 RepID=A0A7W5Z7C1_9HYPH|nr:universal stress protein [Pseudochelatococcus contaminans]MBB3811508.1 nucleotide-binding universal stress UspA family protein [Pseudochelatococcus contaminans]
MKILGLIDGSTYAESVCDHIAWIAGKIDASVEILHVIGRRDLSTEPVNLSGNIGLGARTALLEELADLDAKKAKVAQKRGRLLLEDAKARLHAAGIQNVETKLRNGDLVETVLEFEADTDIIVIGKRGEGADFAKGHLGSNLERVVRSTHKAIVIASRAYKPVNKLLIAYDGGAMAIKTVDQVSRSPILAGLSCKLVMAGDDNAENRKKLDDAAVILKAAGYAPETALVQGQADKVITGIIEQESFDLLAMGAYSHSRLRSLFIGSTTTEMIRSCKVPVVIFR